jgi:hypothetical protein
MQDELIALSGFQGNAGLVYNVYVDITDEIGTPYTGPSIDVHINGKYTMGKLKSFLTVYY